MNRKKLLKILGVVALFFLLLMGIFVIWASNPRDPMLEAVKALNSSVSVTVIEKSDSIEFIPDTYTAGYIFYPGGKVDEVSYAPLAHKIAEHGILVVIVRMPLYLAVFDINAAEDIIESYPNVVTWVIGGHSLGGSMAANYVINNLEKTNNLVLVGSYPASSDNFTSIDANILSIYGTEDGGYDEIEINHNLLSNTTIYEVIEGGNHAQFGYYGIQEGDGTATVSREYQHEIATNVTVSFIQDLAKY